MLLRSYGLYSSLPIRLMATMSSVKVKLEPGTLVGVEEKLPRGKPLYAFRGVPYAEPPIGNLRFKPPVPLKKFSVPELDCSKERDICFQKDMFNSELKGSEDCLFLNVYTPVLPEVKPTTTKLLPVMIWIHGGAFLFGSGNSDLYSPEYLVEENVIVVTFNYRLSTFGFLYLPEAGIEGNAGLKDQLEVFKWVKQNITKFGGDPNNVTVFGESAGAASTHLHLLSKNSRKYFHKVICQSGTSTMEWVMQKHPEERTRLLAKNMGCTEKSDKKILQFLQTEPTVNLLAYMLSTLTDEEKRLGLPMPFKPVVEKDSPDAIITKKPIDLMKQSNLYDIPVMVGNTSSEGLVMVMNSQNKREIFDKDFSRMIPTSVNLTQGSTSAIKVGEEIKKFYFKGKNYTEETDQEMTDLMTDYNFGIGLNLTAELHSKFQKNSSLYFYKFSYCGELNMIKKFMQLTHLKGACHSDDCFYLFNMKMIEMNLPEENEAAIMRRNVCKLWTNFAKTSNPTPDSDESFNFKWDPVKVVSSDDKSFDINCLDIDSEFKMIKNPDKERIDFWRSIYSKWNENFLKPKL